MLRILRKAGWESDPMVPIELYQDEVSLTLYNPDYPACDLQLWLSLQYNTETKEVSATADFELRSVDIFFDNTSWSGWIDIEELNRKAQEAQDLIDCADYEFSRKR